MDSTFQKQVKCNFYRHCYGNVKNKQQFHQGTRILTIDEISFLPTIDYRESKKKVDGNVGTTKKNYLERIFRFFPAKRLTLHEAYAYTTHTLIFNRKKLFLICCESV